MAGIGFKLRHFIEEGTYSGIIKGYLYSAIISAGPWLLTILTLGGISLITKTSITLFQETIVYIYSFSLIITGIFQFVLTRYLADKLYQAEIESHIPSFISVILLILIPQTILAFIGCYYLSAPFIFKIHAGILYLIVNIIWLALIFLGVVRAYQMVIWAFLIGSVISLLSTSFLGSLWKDTSAITGYLIGQITTLILLLWVLFSEFPVKKIFDFSFIKYIMKYSSLCFLGLGYYLSLWIDKFIFRFSSHGVLAVPAYFYAAPSYEITSFLAQLTIIPALAVFFIRVETDFFESYRDYYLSISAKEPLSIIYVKKEKMKNTLKEGLFTLIKVQAFFTFFLIFLAPEVFNFFSFNAYEITLLRVAIIGAFFQILMFFVIIIMLYYEFYNEALLIVIYFLAGNAFLTWMFLKFTPALDGWGYVISAFIGLAIAIFSLMFKFKKLEFITFFKQPISSLFAGSKEFLGKYGVGRFIKKNYEDQKI